MISFFIDTSLSYIRLAIFKDDFLLDFINEKCDTNMSSLFDVRVKELFDRNNLKLTSVDKILAVTGPGSFTGIRVGLTFAKVLAFSLSKGIIPVSELQVLASTSLASSNIASLIDARRGYVYAGIYDNNLNVIKPDAHILLSDFIADLSFPFVSYDSFDNISVLQPNINFTKVFMKNKDNDEVSPHVLNPNYLKLTEAEETLRRKKNIDSQL